MPNVAQAVYGKLSTTDAITAIVGAMIKPLHEYQGARDYPSLVYRVPDERPDRCYTGSTGLVDAEVLIDCLCRDYATSLQLAEIVRSTLDNAAGTWGGVMVVGAFHRHTSDATLQYGEGAEADVIYQHELRFDIWYRNS